MTQQTDPVTNALALQMEFGDDELKAAVDERIAEIVKREIRFYMQNNSHEVTQRVIVDNASTFNNQVIRAVKEFYISPRNIY